MPASLPGSPVATNQTGNPSAGTPVMFDLLSGPKGSPKDGDMTGNASTGGLSTGIGFGANALLDGFVLGTPGTSPLNYQPGVTKPDGTASADSTIMYIGGGKSGANVNGTAPVVPYTAGFGIGHAGNAGARDAGAGPAFTGFAAAVKTAAAAVAAGAVVSTGFNNRSGVAMRAGTSQFAVATAATPAVA